MFRELLDKFDDLSINDKRKEIKDELLYLTMICEKLCDASNIDYRKILDDEVKELISDYETEDEYLDCVFTYLEALKELIGSYLERS